MQRGGGQLRQARKLSVGLKARCVGSFALLVLCGGIQPVQGVVPQPAGRVAPTAEASLDDGGGQQLLPGLAEAAGDDGRSVDTPNLFASIAVAFGSAECGGVLHHAMFDGEGGVTSRCAMTAEDFARDVASRGLEWSTPSGFDGASTIASLCSLTCPQVAARRLGHHFKFLSRFISAILL